MTNKSLSRKILGIIACGVFLIAWERVKATELGYQVEETRKSIEDMQSQMARVEEKLETASSPSHLAEAARKQLGMIPAPLESIKFMDVNARPDIASSRSVSLRLWRKLRSWYRPTS